MTTFDDSRNGDKSLGFDGVSRFVDEHVGEVVRGKSGRNDSTSNQSQRLISDTIKEGDLDNGDRNGLHAAVIKVVMMAL